MTKEEWGVKRLCPTTGKRFYDLNKSPVVSPYTGEIVQIDVPGRKGGSAAHSEVAKPKAVKAKVADDDDVLVDDDDAVVEAEDELLEEEDDDTVSLDELSDVAGDDDDDS